MHTQHFINSHRALVMKCDKLRLSCCMQRGLDPIHLSTYLSITDANEQNGHVFF